MSILAFTGLTFVAFLLATLLGIAIDLKVEGRR